MKQEQIKLALVTAVLAILLHLNYQSGFVPEKDFWTVAGVVLTILGVDVSQLVIKQKKADSDATGST